MSLYDDLPKDGAPAGAGGGDTASVFDGLGPSQSRLSGRDCFSSFKESPLTWFKEHSFFSGVLCCALLLLTVHTIHDIVNNHGSDTNVRLDCQWVNGDGIGEGGSETYLGDTSTRTDCVELVMSKATGANGVTYSQTASECKDSRGCNRCYAEYGLSASNGRKAWQTCTLAGQLTPPVPVPADWHVTACDWIMGDGTCDNPDTPEEHIGQNSAPGRCSETNVVGVQVTDAAQCVSEVLRQHPQANGATAHTSIVLGLQSDQCYAEYGMTKATAYAGEEWETCKLVPNYCTYQDGDGVGGIEEQVGQASSAQECVNMVLEHAPAANGATYHAEGGTDCYAELGMSGVSQGETDTGLRGVP